MTHEEAQFLMKSRTATSAEILEFLYHHPYEPNDEYGKFTNNWVEAAEGFLPWEEQYDHDETDFTTPRMTIWSTGDAVGVMCERSDNYYVWLTEPDSIEQFEQLVAVGRARIAAYLSNSPIPDWPVYPTYYDNFPQPHPSRKK
jgi:hypothetical protein